MAKYDKIAKFYDKAEGFIEKRVFSKYRKKLFEYVNGFVLEVGVGTGKNFPYYPEGVRGFAIDVSKNMLKIAEKRKKELNLENIELLEMDAMDIKFENDTFDTVFSTFVFCTVPDPIKALKEVKRVLKRNGTAVFLEHMKSKNILYNIPLYLMQPMTKLFLGTSMIRETEDNIRRAGLNIIEVQYLFKDIVRLIIAKK
ncbi:class I SAM-dependent methyltransferase [Thermosipho ferrireducens]|uniref:Class I SAM-dependent methyltransferase n=1 Tax=Thermosipho ferrireducens TaxID=2571116 RepID=A0ABX7S761_9BACT|nr:class I SAM-dependent methyltransferase [Thermosipho ferrireducens]QTA37625.1 class I SAM-dependent methyltransferase [Thermosipho ferrireducens]